MSKKNISSKKKSVTHLPIPARKDDGSNKHSDDGVFKKPYRNGGVPL